MSEGVTLLWIARSWVGAAAVMAPFKAALEAQLPDSTVADLWGPAFGEAPAPVDKGGTLTGFSVAVRPSVVIAVPEGAFEALDWMAGILTNSMASQGKDQRQEIPLVQEAAAVAVKP